MALASPGIGSNLDINSIVSQLMSVEQRPLAALARREASFQAKLSAIGTLKGALSSFQTAVKGLSDSGKFQSTKVTAADSTILTASGSANAVPGTYGIEVSKLAQAQKLVSAGQAISTDPIGTGTVTFDFGTIDIGSGSFDSATGKYTGASFTPNGSGTKTVTIASGSDSLSGIRDAINSAKIGITASIINDGGTSPARLVLTQANTGKSNSVKISVSGDASLQSLLNHDPSQPPTAQALSETVTAQNAEFKIDGVQVSKNSNTVTDVLEGVTLNLAKTNIGAATTLTVARDSSSVTGAVGQFVFAYNQINNTLKELSAYNSATKQGSVLTGDATVRTIQSQIRNILTAPVAGGASAYSVLSQIGVTIQKDGTLAVDNAKLQSAAEANLNDIASLFAAVGKSSDSLVKYSGSTTKTVPDSYTVSISQPATRGSVTGGAAAQLTIDEFNDTLEVNLNGLAASVSLARKTYNTSAALALEIQSKINGASIFANAGAKVTASEAGGVIQLTSSSYGSTSRVSITGGSGKAALFGTSQTELAGVDVAGTLNGASATGSGQTLTGAAGTAADGLRLEIFGATSGSRGTVNFSKGYAYQFDQFADSILGSSGPLSSRIDGLNASIKSLTQQRERISDRLADVEKRYRAQFTALDVALANMTKTSNFLQQQLSNLPKIE